MRTSKDFLIQECTSLKHVLHDTLRFKYGLKGSREFFEECDARLTYISQELNTTADTDFVGLRTLSALLGELSILISRIERSSIDEYSWPFVEELKSIAVALCTEDTATSPDTPPELHVLSGGGLGAYAIHPEQSRPSGSRRRIHIIVFPRTLKHFVLLHAILGHEIGHAMLRCSKHQKALNDIFRNNLFNAGVFSGSAATATHLYDTSAPAEVQAKLGDLAKLGVTAANFFGTAASWPAWTEEVLCDFIGLLTFGPSFVAAECNLLYAMDPLGTTVGPKHPPVGWRVNYLLQAAHVLGYDSTALADSKSNNAVVEFWKTLRTKQKTDTWFDVFSQKQLQDTTRELADFLKSLPPSLYPQPVPEQLSACLAQLFDVVPPVGFNIDNNQIVLRKLDFRQILYAGWIGSSTPPDGVSFEQINRLCEQGIMQQGSIELRLRSVP